MSEVHKSFTSYPTFILDTNGELCDFDEEIEQWKNDVKEVTALAEWNIDYRLLEDLEKYLDSDIKSVKSNELGRILGITIPKECAQNHAVSSRFSKMVCARAINETKSWLSRYQVSNKTSKKYVSQGWLRTANSSIPYDISPKMSLSMVDKSYAFISNEPAKDGFIELRTVIGKNKRIVIFPFDTQRFPHSDKITLPDISLNENNDIRFNFTSQEFINYPDISDKYVISVDVGITNYTTVSVVNSDGEIVYSTTLSRRVHSLANKVRNANKQVASLQKKNRKEEAKYHRESNSRRKRELAILAAQEIADIAYSWDNAVVVFEDLSWVSNTMQNGRWNRGELVKWTEHYAHQNGSLIFKVSARNTSQTCHKCDKKITFKGWHKVVCVNEHCRLFKETQDRDTNATGNIGKRFFSKKTLSKTISTRKKSKKYTGGKRKKRTPDTRESLKYPRRDRRKNSLTPKRGKKQPRCREVSDIQCSVGEHEVHNFRVTTGSGEKHTTTVTEMQHENTIGARAYPNGRLCQ